MFSVKVLSFLFFVCLLSNINTFRPAPIKLIVALFGQHLYSRTIAKEMEITFIPKIQLKLKPKFQEEFENIYTKWNDGELAHA